MWKKMSPNSNNSQKIEETPKRNKWKFTKKETPFSSNNSTSESKKTKRPLLKNKALVPLKVDVV
ncbi:unnamed protein product, partial [Larinioides sclopetarius]